jgi:hypothetical protein
LLRKLYEVLAAIATVVTILTPFSGLISQHLEQFGVLGWPLSAASWLAAYGVTVILVTGAILLGYAGWRLWQVREKWQTISRRQLAFVQQFAQFARETAEHRANASDGSYPDERMLANHLYQFLQTSLGHVAATMSAYTGRACHASIKSYRQDSGNIKTEARDANHVDRDKADEVLSSGFSYKDSTPFADILDNPESNAYVANGLRRLARKTRYTNKNPHWHQSYDATAIVPITLSQAAERVDPSTVIAFLCVDNFGGRFDRKACVDLLATFARLYYVAMAENVRIAQEAQNLAESRGA